MFQCATASSDALHLTLLLAVRYSSGCQAHLDAQRTPHTIAQISIVFQLCIARCHSPSFPVVKQSLPASSSLKASQSSALNSSMACRKVISSTWPPASRSISPLLLALTCAGLKEDILTVPSKVEIKSGSSLIGQAVNSEQFPSTTRKGVTGPLVVNHTYTIGTPMEPSIGSITGSALASACTRNGEHGGRNVDLCNGYRLN